jgi:hypothetical protein
VDKYGDVFSFQIENAVQGRPSKSLDDWKTDPDVISVTEKGLPPGWFKIIRQAKRGKKVFFKSPTKARIL